MGAAVILGAVSCLASTEFYKVGNITWQYEVSGGEATVTRWNSSATTKPTYLSIPSTINGYSVVGVKGIGSSDTVETISIPSTVTSIGDYAFNQCLSLRSISIPNGVTKLGNGVFYYCYSLTSISLPSSLTSLGTCVFDNCTNLTSITIPSMVKTIGESCFARCQKLTKVVVPDSVDTIGKFGFWNCTKLTSVTLPSSLQKLNGSTFMGCSELSAITLPKTLTCIGDVEFAWCSKLKTLTVPDKVTSIGKKAFYECDSLTSITIPSSVTSIGTEAFGGCSALSVVYVDSESEKSRVKSLMSTAGCYVSSVEFRVRSGSGGDGGGSGGNTQTTCTVTFNANGGKVSTSSRTYTVGSSYGTLPTPTRSGYEFEGWYTSSSGGSYIFSSSAVTGRITLYAHWSVSREYMNWKPFDSSSVFYLTAGEEVSIDVGGSYNVDRISGLPSGLKFDNDYYCFEGGVCALGMDTISGAAKKAGTYKVTFYATKYKGGATIKQVTRTMVVRSSSGGGGGSDDDSTDSWTLFSKARTFSGYVMNGDQYVGTIQIKTAKAKENRRTGCTTSKFTATVQVLGEKKVSLKGEYNFCVDYGYAGFTMETRNGHKLSLYNGNGGTWFGGNVTSFMGTYDGYDVEVEINDGAKKSYALDRGAAFWMDTAEFSELLGDDTYEEYLPDGIDVTVKGTKWVLPKAGKVVYNRKYDWIDESKLGENPSGLKLTFKAKDGTFKGSFKAYVDKNGRPKATTVTVTGFVVDGIGYGIATIKKVGSVAIVIE